MGIYQCEICDTTKDDDYDGCEEVENKIACTGCYESVIEELLSNHGIEDNGYTLQQAKAITGVAKIIKHRGVAI